MNKFLYTWRHKIAFLEAERQLLGKNTLSGYLHDSDKLILYIFFSDKMAHNIHTSHARHHLKHACCRKDYVNMVIDWECARKTKPDKPLNAYGTLYKYYPQLELKILPILKEFNLDNK